MATKAITSASARALQALRQVVDDPTIVNSRAAAEAIVTLRQQFEHDGLPDWTGRSPGYRDCIERLYRQAEVPKDSDGGLQANLRYHVGNVLRQVAPPEELAALGLSVDGPLARVKSNRVAGPRRPKPPRVALFRGVTSSAGLATLALAAVRTIADMGDTDGAEETLRLLLDETVQLLTRTH